MRLFGGSRNMEVHKQLFRSCLIILALAALTTADKSTIERLRKHQEWLKQRNLQKAYVAPTTMYKKSFELANLWRFNKHSVEQKNMPSINDVFPENEPELLTTMPAPTSTSTSTPTSTPTPTSTTTPSTTTSAKPMQITTEKYTTTTTPTTATTPTTTTTTSTTTTTTTPKPSTEAIPTTTPFMTPSTVGMPEKSAARSYFAVTMPSSIESTTTALVPGITPATTATTKRASIEAKRTTTTTTKKPKMRPYPRWGNWSKWSACTRSCGGGVMQQQRKCISR